MGPLRGVEDSSDSDSDLMPQPRYIPYMEEVVAGPFGQLKGVEDSSDSESDLMPQPRYRYGGRCVWSLVTAERRGGQL